MKSEELEHAPEPEDASVFCETVPTGWFNTTNAVKWKVAMEQIEREIEENKLKWKVAMEQIKREIEENKLPDEPRDTEMYLKAIEEEKERDRFVRVMVLGDYGQGKSSLTRRLLGQSVEDIHISRYRKLIEATPFRS
ncbi:uncharacterized protein LOC128557412 [Mercenaria mercenaria]|uniref:uncharacterized protein LOC128557412 n=1 Tax=Mercenaria mercenaria TaxID=6596 RepID=UPI00234F951A|nr:uncharacterized protein LOC128557412 [Mercenaria mercenaria]